MEKNKKIRNHISIVAEQIGGGFAALAAVAFGILIQNADELMEVFFLCRSRTRSDDRRRNPSAFYCGGGKANMDMVKDMDLYRRTDDRDREKYGESEGKYHRYKKYFQY